MYDFAMAHPVALFFLAWLGVFFVGAVLRFILQAYTRTVRARIIALHGWPPPHLDADGDWKPEVKE